MVDRDAAEDVVQDVWIAAARQPSLPRRPRAWLARVTRNVAARSIRDRMRARDREFLVSEDRTAESAANEALRRDTIRALREALDELNPLYGEVVRLRFFESLSVNDTATRLGVPPETVRTRLRRAVGQLRVRLETKLGEGDDRGSLARRMGPRLDLREPPRPPPAAHRQQRSPNRRHASCTCHSWLIRPRQVSSSPRPGQGPFEEVDLPRKAHTVEQVIHELRDAESAPSEGPST